MDVDFKLIISGLGFFISLMSFGMAYSAKREAKQTIILDLIHKKTNDAHRIFFRSIEN